MALKFNSSDIKKIEGQVTKLVQDEIKRKNLVDTGSLLRSISTKITSSNNNFSINVFGNDYYQVLDDEHNITKDSLSGPGFDKIIKELEDLYVQALEDSIK